MIIKHRMVRKRMFKQRMTLRTGRMSTLIMSQKRAKCGENIKSEEVGDRE